MATNSNHNRSSGPCDSIVYADHNQTGVARDRAPHHDYHGLYPGNGPDGGTRRLVHFWL